PAPVRHVGPAPLSVFPSGWLLSFLIARGLRLSCSAGIACCLVSTLGRDSRRRDALGTPAPVDDLGFVDLVPRVVGRRQARDVADRTVDVDHPAAGSADEVVMVVAGPILIAGRRARRLDPPEEALVGEGREGVVHGLPRD